MIILIDGLFGENKKDELIKELNKKKSVHFGLLNRPDNYISKLKTNKFLFFLEKENIFCLFFNLLH